MSMKEYFLKGFIASGWFIASVCLGAIIGMHLVSYKIDFLRIEEKIKAIEDVKRIVCQPVKAAPESPYQLQCTMYNEPESVNPV